MKSLVFNGLKILVHNKVYEPSDDTWLLIDLVEDTLSKKGGSDTCVDLGCGTGVLGLYALSRGYCRKVLFIDINPYATMNTFLNLMINRFNHRSVVLLSEPYCSVGKVDVVLANPPYLPRDEYGATDVYEESNVIGGLEGFETSLHFVDFASETLVNGGLLFITYSSLTKPGIVEKYIVRKGFDIITRRTNRFFYEELVALGAVKK